MIAALFWIEALLLCLAVLMPVLLALRGRDPLRGRRGPALALHRAQLRELDRDRSGGLIAPAEHAAARLELARRILDADREDGIALSRRDAGPWIALALAPPAALLLYLVGGQPGLTAQPQAWRVAQLDARARQDDALIASLRDGLARLDPARPEARQGYVLLGQVEAARGDFAAAARAWRVALSHGFEPELAVRAAEAQSRADGAVGAQSVALFRRALETGPADAAWRPLALQRIAEFEHQSSHP